MFGLLIIDSFYEQLLKSKFTLTEISNISELIHFTTINCINVNDFDKFRLLTTIIKSHWIYLSLAYITHPCVHCYNVEISNLDFLAESVNEDIIYVNKHLEYLKEKSQEKSIKNRIIIFEGYLNKIKKIIDFGGEKSWGFYLEEFLSNLINFQETYSMFSSALLIQIIQSLALWQNETEMNMLRKLKLMLANQVQCKQELNKFCYFLKNSSEIKISDLLNPDSEIFIKYKGNEMQESFKKYQEFANIINLKMKICYKCSTRHKVDLDSDSISVASCNSISMSLYPVTSTPIRVAHSPMKNKNKLPPEDIDNTVCPITNIQTQSSSSLNEKNVSPVNKEKPKVSTGRYFWTIDETYLIYKGVQEKLQWCEIKNKYFKKSKRTNVNIKDRWRTVLLKPDLMNQLENLYQNELSN